MDEGRLVSSIITSPSAVGDSDFLKVDGSIRVSLSAVWCYQVLSGAIRCYQVLPGATRCYQVLPGAISAIWSARRLFWLIRER